MRLAAFSMMKNRCPWILEWVVFHHLVGVTDFVIYLHECEDGSAELISKLSGIFRIKGIVVNSIVAHQVQSVCMRHSLAELQHEYDWFMWIDGDEFLFPTRERTLPASLLRFDSVSLSAVGVYWRCFGSSGHLLEPKGLITEKFRQCSEAMYEKNRHIKSILRADPATRFDANAHFFETRLGTFDENLTPLRAGFDLAHVPTWNHLCINHYGTQSRQFFEKVKSRAKDAGPNLLRNEHWWEESDRNEVYDTSLEHLRKALNDNVSGICKAIGVRADELGGLVL